MIKILIIDDDKLIRWSLKELFSQEGYKVDAVATVREALGLVESFPHNLIFVDLETKDENGIEMMKKIISLRPEAKIIILSAFTRQQIEPEIGELGVFSIIEKPFKSEQIKSIAKQALDTK
ncbi:MAG: response regulator [Candidatus Aminicenantes bacterium]|nr:MAG: response regulator [Candidatus Aminicenantes bacterium]